MNPRLLRGIGGFALGWTLITILNILMGVHEPAWAYYPDTFFLIVAALAIVSYINPKSPPSQ